MIGAINPVSISCHSSDNGVLTSFQNATWTLEKQIEAVNRASFQVTPGETLPSEGATSLGLPVPTATTIPAPTATPTQAPQQDDHSHLNAGQIAGISIGAAAVLVLAGALVYICGRQSRRPVAGDGTPSHRDRNSFPVMTDTKFSPSPANDPYRSGTSYTTDPYRPATNSPPLHPPAQYGSIGELHSPPLTSPNNQTFTSFGSATQGGMTSPTQFYTMGAQPGHHNVAPPPAPAPPPPPVPPVELPTSGDPGNSPIPPYSAANRQMSWGAGQEAAYRPGGKR
jgi:hypothetical protein